MVLLLLGKVDALVYHNVPFIGRGYFVGLSMFKTSVVSQQSQVPNADAEKIGMHFSKTRVRIMMRKNDGNSFGYHDDDIQKHKNITMRALIFEGRHATRNARGETIAIVPRTTPQPGLYQSQAVASDSSLGVPDVCSS